MNKGGVGVPTDEQTTVMPSHKVSLVHMDYDNSALTFGLVTKQKQYDWGTGAPGALLQEVDTTYQWQVNGNYLAAHFLDAPASVVTKSGSGCRLAETDYAYDESGYLTAYPGTLPTGSHVAAPNSVRGNPTSVTHQQFAANTCPTAAQSGVSAHMNGYATGEVYQQIDPLGNATTHSYDPVYKGALPTKTCNALNQCVSATYDVNTGLLASFTDANATQQASGTTAGDSAHTTTYGYDLMKRMTTASLPDGGQTTFNYPSATTLERLQKVNATSSDDSFAYFDGLGHLIQSKHITPSGNAMTDSLYDAFGRAVSVSNPYFVTTEPTYGIATSQYDALGRVIQTTKQDGGISTVSYIDNCTIATDEAGKQRRACSDELGRLTSVDEPGDPSAGASPIANGGGTSATGYVTIAGSEQSQQVSSPPGPGGTGCPPPPEICDQGGGGGSTYIYDSGAISINVSGYVYTAHYDANDTSASIAATLAAAINADSSGPLTASASGSTVYLASRATGSQLSYSLSSSWAWDSVDFTAPSFTASGSNSISGGTDGPPVFGGHAYTTLYSYDTLGNLLQVTQQGGTSDQSKWRVRTFTYDSLGRLLTANNPESGTISYSYDATGNLATKTDARGLILTPIYDPLNRLKYKQFSDGTTAHSFYYDAPLGNFPNETNVVGRPGLPTN